MVQQTEGTAAPPPPPPHRRPRVREVSSRFMSPSPHSSSNFGGDPSKSPLPSQQQRSVSAQRQRRRLELEGDENRPLETQRSLESPFTTNLHKKHHRSTDSLVRSSSSSSSSRSTPLLPSKKPDTPIFHTTVVDSSRNRPNPRSAAAKLLQSSINTSSSSSNSSSDLRSSMPETDQLPSTSNRFLSERNPNNLQKSIASPFSRSSNSPFNTCEPQSVKAAAAAAGVVSLPPVPKSGAAADTTRKGKKVCSHQEDVHSLKLLHNHWLQLRFANAKAEAAIKAQKSETERTFYSLGVKMSTLHDSVKEKRIQLGILQRMKALTTILEAQMPFLEMWSAMEGDYTNSVSQVVDALSNTSLRLPLSGNVRGDVKEVREAMNSATKLMEMIFSHVQSFFPKGEEMESLVLEVAKVAGGERALIEECGEQMSMTFASQVEEMSLQSQLIQMNRNFQKKPSL